MRACHRVQDLEAYYCTFIDTTTAPLLEHSPHFMRQLNASFERMLMHCSTPGGPVLSSLFQHHTRPAVQHFRSEGNDAQCISHLSARYLQQTTTQPSSSQSPTNPVSCYTPAPVYPGPPPSQASEVPPASTAKTPITGSKYLRMWWGPVEVIGGILEGRGTLHKLHQSKRSN